MKVWYITMAFPVPSETFVVTELVALKRRGVDISVHALAPKWFSASAETPAASDVDIPVTHASWQCQLRGLWLCLVRPRFCASLVRLIFGWSWRQPMHCLVALLSIPRILQLFEKIGQCRPDVVHLFWGHYPSLLGYLILEHLSEVVLTTSLSAYDLKVSFGCTKAVAPRADAVRTWAAANVTEIEALGVPPERILVAYQGLNLSHFTTRNTEKKVPRRIISAGRLIPAKGMDEVLKVFHRVVQRWSDASLVILGDGPERYRLERLAKSLGVRDQVRFPGHVTQEEVFYEMMVAEVFLFLSWHAAERLPNVVKEAIASRCLCIVSETVGIAEVLRHGEHGFVVPQHDVGSAYGHLVELFSEDRAFPHPMIEKSCEHLFETFDTDVTIPRLQQRWEILQSQKRGVCSSTISG